MPRKKSKEGRPMNAGGELLRAVRLELPPSVHNALRVQAAKEDMSMAALVRGLVEAYLAKKKGKGNDT